MKMRKITLLVVLLAISLMVFGQNETEFHLDKTYPLKQGGTVYLSAHDAEIVITGENRQDVAVKVDYLVTTKGIEWGTREFYVEVANTNGDLYIQEHRKSSKGIIGYSNSSYNIVIKAPVGSNWEITGDDDDYQITAIDGSISITADDADATLKNCRGRSFFFDLDDGDIVMDQAAGKLTARVDDGDLKIANATLETIDYRGDDGNVTLVTSVGPNAMFKFIGDDTRYNIVITRGGGTFTINHDDGKINFDDNFRLMNKEEHRTVLSLTGGRGKVAISGDDIDVNLTVSTSN